MQDAPGVSDCLTQSCLPYAIVPGVLLCTTCARHSSSQPVPTFASAAGVWKAVIDDEHTNPLRAWKEMGSPAYLTAEQELALHRASELRYAEIPSDEPIRFIAQPESVTIFRVRLK